MSDYISRQKLLNDIERYHLSDGKFQHWVEVQPSVEAEPVRHGRWIKTRMPVTGAIEIKCSECDQKYYTAFPLVWGYCPNCGARMDGEHEAN